MNPKVLVAYASKYGSTQEVAATVAAILREGGAEVDLQPMRKVQSLTSYGAIVLGAPLYIGRWHKDAQRFLTSHQGALAQRPLAVFTLGPTRADEGEWQSVRTQLEQELAKYPWIKPVAVELFGGRYDPARLRFPDSLLASLPASPLHGVLASDIRDWVAIRAWAGSLAAKLQ